MNVATAVAPKTRTKNVLMDGVLENPSLLKLALYCYGIRLTVSATDALSDGREIIRTRAGLGSGLEVILPGEMWTNIPVRESFCLNSPFTLDAQHEHFFIRYKDEAIEVTLAPRPSWYSKKTSSGTPMVKVGSLQGTYLGIYAAKVCEFWQTKPQKENCKYCSLGLNLGADDATEKTVADVVEVVKAARAESAITYVDFNTGHHEDEGFLDILEPIVKAVKEETGLLIGVQTPPHHDLKRYDRLRDMGVNRVSFCFEIYNSSAFERICPGKHRFYGLDRYLATMDYCAALKPKSIDEPWVTNGEIIAGLEDPLSSIAAIDRITSVGAIPTVCVFRPLIGTEYQHLDPPKLWDMVPVFRHLYEACMEKNLPIGIAPNIHVSLVMLPEECAGLSSLDDSFGYRWKKMKLGLKKSLFRRIWSRRFKADLSLG